MFRVDAHPVHEPHPVRLKHLRDLMVEAPLASGHRFLSAASGLVTIEDRIGVIGDDEHHLALFQSDGSEEGRLLRLLPRDLPLDAKLRKARKPDFEILIALPTIELDAKRRFLALGSGSTSQRMRGVQFGVDVKGALCDLQMLYLSDLYGAIAAQVPELNLEGAVVRGSELLLFNRGNMRNPETCIISTDLANVTSRGSISTSVIKRLQLPTIVGVPLSVTDACLLEDGDILLSAVAEATGDSYADGQLMGSAAVILNQQLEAVALESLSPLVKVEGIVGRQTADGIEILCVTDADDPGKAAALYSGLWRI